MKTKILIILILFLSINIKAQQDSTKQNKFYFSFYQSTNASYYFNSQNYNYDYPIDAIYLPVDNYYMLGYKNFELGITGFKQYEFLVKNKNFYYPLMSYSHKSYQPFVYKIGVISTYKFYKNNRLSTKLLTGYVNKYLMAGLLTEYKLLPYFSVFGGLSYSGNIGNTNDQHLSNIFNYVCNNNKLSLNIGIKLSSEKAYNSNGENKTLSLEYGRTMSLLQGNIFDIYFINYDNAPYIFVNGKEDYYKNSMLVFYRFSNFIGLSKKTKNNYIYTISFGLNKKYNGELEEHLTYITMFLKKYSFSSDIKKQIYSWKNKNSIYAGGKIIFIKQNISSYKISEYILTPPDYVNINNSLFSGLLNLEYKKDYNLIYISTGVNFNLLGYNIGSYSQDYYYVYSPDGFYYDYSAQEHIIIPKTKYTKFISPYPEIWKNHWLVNDIYFKIGFKIK